MKSKKFVERYDREYIKELILEMLRIEGPKTRAELVNILELPRTSIYVLLLELGDWLGVKHGASTCRRLSGKVVVYPAQSMIGTCEITTEIVKEESGRGRPVTYFKLKNDDVNTN